MIYRYISGVFQQYTYDYVEHQGTLWVTEIILIVNNVVQYSVMYQACWQKRQILASFTPSEVCSRYTLFVFRLASIFMDSKVMILCVLLLNGRYVKFALGMSSNRQTVITFKSHD